MPDVQATDATPYTEPFTPLTVKFTASPRAGVAPLSVTFDARTTTDTLGKISSYQWRFGDGITAKGPQVVHIYQAPGTYPARVDVRDNLGYEGSTMLEISVEPAESVAYQLVEYIEDSGFEEGRANFEDYYETSQSVRSSDNPLVGESSLHVEMPGWSNLIMPIYYPWHEGPRGHSLTARGRIRINEITDGTSITLCAVVYYVAGDDTRVEACTESDEMHEDGITLKSTLILDPEKQLNRIYYWLKFSHDGHADLTLDDAHLLLEMVPGTGGQ